MSITPNLCCDETKNRGPYTRVTLLKCINTSLFFFFSCLWQLCPSERWAGRWWQVLGLWGLWWLQVFRDTDCLRGRSYGPIRVFFPASCSWRSEGLFGQSFSITLPIQALRGLPRLGSFSVVGCVRHIEGTPWLGSYSVNRCIRHLKGHPGWGPTP